MDVVVVLDVSSVLVRITVSDNYNE